MTSAPADPTIGVSPCAGSDMRARIVALLGELPSLADPADEEALIGLLQSLYAVGRRDLPLGRLFEGHVDALQIVSRYATPEVARATQKAARDGAVLGVWNADLPGEALRCQDGRLGGGKSYASGAGILTHALVTADVEGGRQLLLLDLARTPPVIDRDWWQVTGMQRSETHIVRWSDAAIEVGDLIGAPDDYVREPWFSGGALRFVAVHAGGVAALFDHVRDHLLATGRADDPHQAVRLSTLFGLAELAAGAVRGAAAKWFVQDDATRLPRVVAARMQVADLADQAITLAEQAVGLQGLFKAHPLAAVITDLSVYLRQPAPDAQRVRVGRAVAQGVLSPAL